MKTFRFIGMALFAILMCVNIASCSSSDDDPTTDEKEESEVTVNEKKIVKIVSDSDDWKETRTFSYDDKGRLIQQTETDEYDNEKQTRTYKFVWGDNAIKCSGDDSYTLNLKNGLVHSNDKGETYTYNQSNRFIKGKGEWSTTTAIWDGDKLVSVSEDDGDEATLTYEKSCKKGYFPLIATIIDFSSESLFIAHPEIAGMRTAQLPSSVTWNYGYEDEKSTLSYEFDKDGYILKIITKEDNSTITITWE